MSDVRERTDGSETVRLYGLDAKAASLMTALYDLDMLVSDGLRVGRDAVEQWRGRHAETFVEDANDVFRKLVRLVQQVGSAKREVAMWPDHPGRDPFAEEAAASARIELPDSLQGTSSAEPDKLDEFAHWCQSVVDRLVSLTGDVNLDGVYAEVVREVSTYTFPGYTPQFLPDEPTYPDDVPPETETVVGDPANYIHLPVVYDERGTIRVLAGELGPWTGAVAAAFRIGDDQLADFLLSYPELADELLAGFADGTITGESALVIMLAYFDEFDSAINGETDGEISREDLFAMSVSTEVPVHVRQAAQHMLDSPQMYMLVETMNDDMDYASDIVGNNGDGKATREDIEAYIEFNDQLAVVEQNFDEFDTAAHGGSADGEVSTSDLEAMAAAGGAMGAAATWLLDHGGPLTRVGYYEQAKEGFFGEVSGSVSISSDSLTLLAVDQQTYADNPDQAAAFVDRRFEPLMGPNIGHLASPDGMRETFTAALTGSDQSPALLERIMHEVADDGTIHNTGLPPAFAEGVAHNMGVVERRITEPARYDADQLPDSVREDYLDTHDFLREVFRDPEAGERLRVAVHEYGISETPNAPDDAAGRGERLRDLGRVQAFVTTAQDNALTDEALDDIEEAAEDEGLRPSIGATADYWIGHVPYADTVNEIADGMGASGGDAVDWVMDQLGVESEDAFARLDDAEQRDRVRKMRNVVNRAVWVAIDLYNADPPDDAVRNSARGEPFVAADGTIKTDMTAGERQALREWATDTVVGAEGAGGPGYDDEEHLGAGANDIVEPPYGVSIEDRR